MSEVNYIKLIFLSSRGIKGFSSNQVNVLKWCLNRSHQALNMKYLTEMAGVGNDCDEYKPLRDKEMRRSEDLVSKIVSVLENYYLNPFSVNMDRMELFNLSSGLPFQGDVESMLNIWNEGKELYEQFLRERIYSNKKEFHGSLSRNKPTLFGNGVGKKKKKEDTKAEVTKANRNILGKLFSLSARFEEPIDFAEALSYPLFPVPLSLSFPHGTKRKTQE